MFSLVTQLLHSAHLLQSKNTKPMLGKDRTEEHIFSFSLIVPSNEFQVWVFL